MAHASGNPQWASYPSTDTLITAQALEALENTLDASAGVLTQARNTANQTIAAAGTWTPVALPAEDFDDDDVHSTVTNTGRFTVTRPGIYQLSALVTWAPNASTATPTRQARLVRSGAPIPSANNSGSYATASSYLTLVIPGILVAVSAGEYVELQVASALAGAALFGAPDAGCVMTSRLVRLA